MSNTSKESKAMSRILKTTSEGEMLPHRFLWEIVEQQAKLASEREREWLKPALVAMVFGFHTVEAYLNFVGERLDPAIWQNERDFFRKEPCPASAPLRQF
jgi:hypothetical protein